jgi:hypothetical protein
MRSHAADSKQLRRFSVGHGMPCPLDRFPTRAPYYRVVIPSRGSRDFVFLRGARIVRPVCTCGARARAGVEGSLFYFVPPQGYGARLQIVAANKNAGKHKAAGYSVEFRGFSWKTYAVTATRLPEALRSPHVRYSTID